MKQNLWLSMVKGFRRRLIFFPVLFSSIVVLLTLVELYQFINFEPSISFIYCTALVEIIIFIHLLYLVVQLMTTLSSKTWSVLLLLLFLGCTILCFCTVGFILVIGIST